MCLNLKVFCERCIKGSVVPTTRCKKKTFLRVLETFRPTAIHTHYVTFSEKSNMIKNTIYFRGCPIIVLLALSKIFNFLICRENSIQKYNVISNFFFQLCNFLCDENENQIKVETKNCTSIPWQYCHEDACAQLL